MVRGAGFTQCRHRQSNESLTLQNVRQAGCPSLGVAGFYLFYWGLEMKLKELIEKLKQIEAEKGDIHVEVRNPAGDCSDVDSVRVLGDGERTTVYIES